MEERKDIVQKCNQKSDSQSFPVQSKTLIHNSQHKKSQFTSHVQNGKFQIQFPKLETQNHKSQLKLPNQKP